MVLQSGDRVVVVFSPVAAGTHSDAFLALAGRATTHENLARTGESGS